MTATSPVQTPEQQAERQFPRTVDGHQLTILNNERLYRHLRFAHPQSGAYHFDLVTWPGYLAITGDMGAYVFARIADMFEFFRRPAVNYGYWAEKCITGGGDILVPSDRKLFERVQEVVEERRREGRPLNLPQSRWQELKSMQEDGHPAQEILRLLGEEHPDAFADAWEWDISEYKYQFVWCLHAIRWGIEVFDREIRELT